MLLNPKIGMRVMTPKHGPGIIEIKEIISEKQLWGNRDLIQTPTGRYGVKLDVPTWVGPLSYYWPDELSGNFLTSEK